MSNDLISREWLEDAFDNLCCHNCKICRNFRIEDSFYKCALIDNAPTVDTTFREVVAYECGQKSVEEQPKGNEKNGKGCWNCRHCKRVHKELVGEEWRCDLNNCYLGYHTVINHWCRHWAKLKR